MFAAIIECRCCCYFLRKWGKSWDEVQQSSNELDTFCRFPFRKIVAVGFSQFRINDTKEKKMLFFVRYFGPVF